MVTLPGTVYGKTSGYSLTVKHFRVVYGNTSGAGIAQWLERRTRD